MPTNRNTKSSPSKKLQTDYQYLEDDNNGQQAAADKNEPRSPSSPSSYRSASNEELLNTKQRSRRTLLWGGKRPSSSSQHGREGSWCGGFGDNSDGNTVSSSSRSVFSQSDDFKRIFDRKRKSQQQQDGQGALIAAQSEGDETNSQFQEEEEVYLVKQHYGYCSIVFSIGQIGVLITMMVQCGVAPLNINPMIGPYPDALSEWGGKNAVNILDDGEWWRLITPIMLHAGVIHLLCNVAVQVETGAFFEREWGSRNWLIVYLTSAVGSSILSVIFMPDAVSVGSSGAVMGLFGGKLAEVICRACESNKTQQGRIGHQVRKEQCAGATCSVIIVMLFSFIPYVDWAAHLGGVLAGFCIGTVLFACETPHLMWKLVWMAIGTGITVAYFAATLTKMYSGDIEPAQELRDVCGYYKQYFDDYECNCMRDEHDDQ